MNLKEKILPMIGLFTILFFLFIGSYNSWEKVIAASGSTSTSSHTHSYTIKVSSSNGDCQHKSWERKKCSCGVTKIFYGNYGDHDYDYDYRVSPTCTEQGYDVYECSICGNTKKDNYKNALGHFMEPNWQNHEEDVVYHWKDCTRSGCTYMESEEHQWNYTNVSEYQHRITCSVCSQTHTENHVYNDAHKCVGGDIGDAGCEHNYKTSFHWFPGLEGDTSCGLSDYGCSGQLKVVIDAPETENLPLACNYTMIGCGPSCPPLEEKSLDKVSVTYNYIPYGNEEGEISSSLKPSIVLKEYKHGTYQEHADQANLNLAEWGIAINDDVFAKGNVNETRGNWTSSSGANSTQGDDASYDYAYFNSFIYQDEKILFLEKVGDGLTWEVEMPTSGHWEIQSWDFLDEVSFYMDTKMLFCNGGCDRSDSEATNIYGYVMVGYRDMNGNKIIPSTDDVGNSLPGAPADSRTSGLVWKNGYANGGSYTRKVGPKHGDLDKAGYRYVGYKITNTFSVPNSARDRSDLDGTTEGPSSITARFGDQKKCITYYYEKVTLDVEHKLVRSDGSIAPLPTNLNKTGIHLKGTQIENSVNKEIYPGYILMSYDKRIKKNNQVYENKEYDWTYSDSSKEETTRPYTAAEKQTLPTNIIKKSIRVRYDDASSDKVGYREDKKLTFYYQTVDVKITHIDKDVGTIIKSLDGTKDLSYTKDLTGQYLNEVSLELRNGPATLYMNGQAVQYDARGYVLDSVKVKIDGISKELLINKDKLEQYLNATGNQTIIDSYKYVIDNFYLTFRLNINDIILRALIQDELKNEIDVSVVNLSQKMQRNTEVTWYYVRANKLVVKHEDTEGNSLITPETIPIITSPVTPKPTPKDFPGFEIEKYKLDGIETPATPATEVTVDDIGADRELIFIYKPTEVPESTEREVELRSADRRENKGDNHASEEYLVDAVDGQSKGSIPTSEDLYSNVIVESFHMKNGIQLKEQVDPTQKFEIRFVQPYVDENKENGNNDYTGVNEIKSNVSDYYVSFEIGYNYFTAENAELQIIDHAVVKNASVEQRANAGTNKGFLNLLPQYQTEPYMEFEKGGQLKIQSKGNKTFSNKGTIGSLASGLYNVTTKTAADGSIIYKADFVLPSVEYMYPDIDELVKKYRSTNDESIMSAQISEMRDNIYATTEIKMDKLTIYSDTTIFNVFTGAYVPLIHAKNRNYLVNNKIINLNPSPDLTSRDVLYSENTVNKNVGNNKIFVQKTAANQLYNTTADVYYRTKQQLKEGVLLATPENPTVDLVITNEPGNTVTVHTPVVDNAKLIIPSPSDTSEVEDTWYAATKTQYSNGVDGTIILGQEFRIQIPHNAQHIDLKGYGNINYNWKGLYSKRNGINGSTGEPKFPENEDNNKHFAEKRQVKFTFGVIYQNTYHPADQWIDLGVSEEINFNFTVPEWEKELWKTGKHKIYTRVIAENCPESYYADDTSATYTGRIQNVANTTASKYIAVRDFTVNVIGEILDLEIRATNDSGWNQLNTSIKTDNFPLGQPGQNKNLSYKYGLKLGYAAFFDITTTGWIGDTTESISITPKYYYVTKTGGNRVAQEVDLYYKKSASGPYIALKDNPLNLDTVMNKDCYRGINYVSRFARLFVTNSNGKFAMDAGRKLTLTYQLLTKYSKTLVNYSSTIKTGTTSEIKLPYATRLVYQRAIEVLKTKYNLPNLPTKIDGTVWDGTDYCIGHWYGAMWLPSSTIAVLKDDPAPKPDGTGKLPADGYIIITFDDVITKDKDNIPYLEYESKDADSLSQVELPNGDPAEVPQEGGIPAVIYEMFSDRVDYSQGMTH